MAVTHNYGWTLPTVHADNSTWGSELNTTIGAIDGQVFTNQTSINTIEGQVQPNSITITRTATAGASLGYMNGAATAGQQSRWLMYETTEAESGGNAGSNLIIQNYTDAGVAIGVVAEFVRSSGNVAFAKAVTVSGTLGVAGALTASNGATVTGSLSVSGNIQGNVVFFGSPTVTDFLAAQSTNLRYLQWSASWWDGWNPTNGLRTWYGNSALMTLDASGNLATAGSVAATSYTTPGTISATGNITSNASISATGNITATGTVEANSGSVVARASGGGNAQIVMQDNTGTARGYCYWDAPSNSVNLAFPTYSNSFQLVTTGDCYANPGSAAHNFVVTQGNGLKPGGGSWGSWSDARIKTVMGDYAAGLDAVLQLRPVTYVYKGDYARSAGGKQFVGLVADEAMKVLPEMVSLQKGTIDGREVDDLKVLDTTSLIFALVNAVKELKAEIEALKAR